MSDHDCLWLAILLLAIDAPSFRAVAAWVFSIAGSIVASLSNALFWVVVGFFVGAKIIWQIAVLMFRSPAHDQYSGTC